MAGTGRVYVNGSPRAVGNNQYDVDIRFDIAFDWGGYNNNGNAYYEIAIHGHSTQSGNATFNVPSGGGGWVWANIGGTKTFRVTMPTSGAAHTISFGAWIDTRINPKYIEATATYTLPARTWQWRVSYNANGGTGAPGAQTKTKGSNLILSGTRPSRTGYIFKGWATSANGGVAYQPGGTYSTDANVTLYAVWQIITYTVSYNANGGTGAPGAQTKNYGATLKLSSTKPTRTNYNFLGWGTSSGSTSVAYAAGGNYTANASITLYAIWQLAYTKPRITSLSASRCNSGGAYAEEGQYAKVTFNWATDRAVSGIKIVCNGTTTNASGSGTSGSVSVVVGANKLSTENSYTVTVSVSDSGGTTSQSTTVAPLAYIMDVKAGGKGVAFGKPATRNNAVDFGWHMYSDGFLVFNGYSLGLQYQSSGGRFMIVTMSNGGSLNFVYQAANASSWTYNFIQLEQSSGVVQFPNGLSSSGNLAVGGTAILKGAIQVSNSVVTGQLRRSNAGGAWIAGRDTAMIRNTADPGTGRFAGLITMKAGSGYWTIGTLGKNLYFSWTTDSNYTANNNTGTNPYIDTSGQYRQPNGITYVNGTGGNYTGTFDFSNLATTNNWVIKTPKTGVRVTEAQWGGTVNTGTGYYIQIKTAQNPVYWGIHCWASDMSLKNSIIPSTENALEKINLIKFYKFYYNNSPKPTQIGFLSQQLETVDEQLVFSVHGNDDDGVEVLQPNEGAIIPLVTKGVQELNKKVDDEVRELKNTISNLEDRIKNLEKIIEELRGVKHGE